MDKLPKDLINKLIDELSAHDFINFCASDISANVRRICDMEEVWIRRLKKDFPKIVNEFPKVVVSPKIVYLELFSKISKLAEEFVETVLREYGETRKFLTHEFSPFLYKIFYELITYTITKALEGGYDNKDKDESWVNESVSDSYFSKKWIKTLYKYLPGIRKREVDSLYAYQDKWEEEIKDPLQDFTQNILDFLLQYK